MVFGYSTGALAYEDLLDGFRMVRDAGLEAVELSVLRQSEVAPFLDVVDSLDLAGFRFVSVHAPSRFSDPAAERRIARELTQVLRPDWHLVLHPDSSSDLGLWRHLGGRLLIENMDKRKPIGRSVDELQGIFESVPDAGFCLDIAHARQVDPTMLESWRLLTRFRDRLREIHISELNTQSRHGRISDAAIRAFGHVSEHVPEDVAVILESPLGSAHDIPAEIARARAALGCQEAAPV